jgi:cytochrome c553
MLLKLQNTVVVLMMVMLLLFGACKKAPEVTHAIANRSDASCLSCHQSGKNGAPVTQHPKYADCLRCHKEADRNKTKGDRENHAQPGSQP